MTTVNLKYRRIDGTNLDGSLITVGSVTITPIDRRDTSAGQMTTAELTVSLGASPPSVQLAAGTYKLRLRGPGVDFVEHRLVPGSGGPFDVDDLDEVDPTGNAVLQPEWKAYIDAAIAGVTVGETTPAGIEGSTAIGQALIVAANQAAGRSAIGAAATSDLAALATLASPALTGNPTAPTASPGDNDTTIATTAFVTAAIAALGTIIAVPAGGVLRIALPTTNLSLARPSLPTGVAWDWEVPGTVPPTNIRRDLGDVWTTVED